MIDVSQEYKDTLVAGVHNFNAYIEITLSDGTVLPVMTNANLRSFSIDDAVSDDNKFTMLGSAIINQCTFTIDNMQDIYYDYNFFDADVVVYVDCALLDGTTERLRKGTYFVEDYRYLDGVIELTCYDNLAKFDKPYSLSTLEYPTTVQSIVDNACTICGVSLSDIEIPHNDILIPNGPISTNATFREVLSKIAQIIGCYVKCDRFGELEFNWCNVDVLNGIYGSLDGGTFDDDSPYSSGDTADGGSFNPWNTGYILASATFAMQIASHNLYYNYSQEVAVVDTIVTGVSVSTTPVLVIDTQYKLAFAIKNGKLILQASDDAPATFSLNDSGELIVTSNNADDTFYISTNDEEQSEEGYENPYDEGSLIMQTPNALELTDVDTATQTFSVGQPGFVISIEENEFLNTELANSTAVILGKQLIGMRFRKATTYHMNDPSIESGDVALLWDRKNRSYPIIVTHTTFKIGGQQSTVCGSETTVKNSANRQTETSRLYNSISSNVQASVDSMNRKFDSFPGLYSTIQTIDGNKTYFIHDKVSLEKSSIIWRITQNTLMVSQDGGTTWNDGTSPNYIVGKNIISETGTCRIEIPTNYSLDTDILTPDKYMIFLQKYGQGDLWVDRTTVTYFIVKGTPNLSFSWEIKW